MGQNSPAKDGISGLIICSLPHANQPMWPGKDIVIREYDDVALDMTNACVQRGILSWSGLKEVFQRKPIAERIDNLRSVVRARIVDYDELPAAGWGFEAAIRVEHARERARAISCGKQNCKHLTVVTPANHAAITW